ncbi:8427_t:CDS:2 [Cetraspora pellucida]|uniref:8427_t:CDS:1 n=1 Tax=Cetraspora pellucida TaxID=1433469 RepID=A0ACA9ND59_9GLOM|nr:8427_t:CDS:2 [Cetraspora pellucida]
MSQSQSNKAKSTSQVKKTTMPAKDLLKKMSSAILDFDEPFHSDTYQNYEESIQHILKDIVKAFRDAASEVAQVNEQNPAQHGGCETNLKKNDEEPTTKLISDLTKRMQQMATHYEQLTITLVARAEINPQPLQDRPYYSQTIRNGPHHQ